MAIKVNGTTVIDDSRNLSNVGGLKTVNGNSLVGSGNISAGASTSYNAVGTYTVAGIVQGGSRVTYSAGTTIAGSGLKHQADSGAHNQMSSNDLYSLTSAGLSGTWRVMTRVRTNDYASSYATGALLCRIS